ncbi:GNAT family N-acetyltransferase [Streptomyces sp. NPDC048639]|uniref:GNAT family N-acetyltransferase n=1 Tax=Streptomyces sp. NPDC048639 TaxID=3365581 RepID=UPI00371A0C71
MVSTRTRPFRQDDIPAASALLAARYGHDPDACAPLLRDAWAAGARGALTESPEGTPTGHLLAVEGDDTRGRHMWSGPGQAAGDADALCRLYASLAGDWLAEGRDHHYVVASVADVPVWQSLCFGQEQVHGLMELGATEHRGADALTGRGVGPEADARTAGPEAVAGDGRAQPVEGFASRPTSAFRIRAAGPGDLDRLAPLFPLIADAHAAAPVFACVDADFYAGLHPGHRELLRDPTVAYWMAEGSDGTALGFCVMRPVGDDEVSPLKPRGSVELALAATAPEARGTGVGRTLAEHALTDAVRRGFRVCVTDWRAANPFSSGFWPRRGFRPVAHRLHRILDPRLTERAAARAGRRGGEARTEA